MLAALLACKGSAPKGDPELEQRVGTQIRRAPAGDLATVFANETKSAASEGRQALLYVGASWCKPCKVFKNHVRAGKYDREFPKLRFIEFDGGYDQDRLGAAGCQSPSIPLFANVDGSGRCAKNYSGYGSPRSMTRQFRILLTQ